MESLGTCSAATPVLPQLPPWHAEEGLSAEARDLAFVNEV